MKIKLIIQCISNQTKFKWVDSMYRISKINLKLLIFKETYLIGQFRRTKIFKHKGITFIHSFLSKLHNKIIKLIYSIHSKIIAKNHKIFTEAKKFSKADFKESK